ncbi:MAG: hypothetical protein AAGG50_05095 [Bacteroidota bacterium]
MGQQQLLLLVLGIVIVALAVTSGIQSFQDQRKKDRFDRKMLYAYELATRLQAEAQKPSALGGGGAFFSSHNTDDAMRLLVSEIDTMYTWKHVGWTQPGLGCFMISFEGYGDHLHLLDDETAPCERNSWRDLPWFLVLPDEIRYREGPNF